MLQGLLQSGMLGYTFANMNPQYAGLLNDQLLMGYMQMQGQGQGQGQGPPQPVSAVVEQVETQTQEDEDTYSRSAKAQLYLLSHYLGRDSEWVCVGAEAAAGPGRGLARPGRSASGRRRRMHACVCWWRSTAPSSGG